MPAKGPLGSSGRVGGGGGSSAGARGGRVTSASKPSARSGMAARRAISLANRAAKVSSITKRTGVAQAEPKIASVTKRRVGTVGQAHGSVKAKANKEIKAERKARGEYLYDKKYYGRPSVNQRKPAAKVKPSSGRMSSRPNPKPRKGNQR